jgi:hypothetical protein
VSSGSEYDRLVLVRSGSYVIQYRSGYDRLGQVRSSDKRL